MNKTYSLWSSQFVCEIIQVLFADKTSESLSAIAADVAKWNEKIDQLDENVDNKEVARYFNERVEAHDGGLESNGASIALWIYITQVSFHESVASER